MSVVMFMPGASRGAEDGVGSPGTEATDGCELPFGCCKSHSGPLQRQSALISDETSLQPLRLFYKPNLIALTGLAQR